MRSVHARQVHASLNINPRRFRAALVLRGASIESVARRANLTSSHVWRVVSGYRQGSFELIRVIRESTGEPGWLFATGQIDVLPDAGRADAAA